MDFTAEAHKKATGIITDAVDKAQSILEAFVDKVIDNSETKTDLSIIPQILSNIPEVKQPKAVATVNATTKK